MSTLVYLCCLIGFLGIAAGFAGLLADLLAEKLIQSWRAADLQERINRARWEK